MNPRFSPPKVIIRASSNLHKTSWDGKRGTFAKFTHKLSSYLIVNHCGYLIEPVFIAAYLQDKEACLLKFPHYAISKAQLLHDVSYLYGTLLGMCLEATGVTMRINRHGRQHDGIIVWNELYTSFHCEGGQDLGNRTP